MVMLWPFRSLLLGLLPALAALLASVSSLAGQAPLTSRVNPTPQSPRRIILDVDPGIDDAMAVLLALQSPELRVEAITVVSGNVMVDLGAENALKLVELAGRPDVPVAKGAKYPLQRKPVTAEAFHGQNGLGEVQLPAPRKSLDSRHAVDVILDIVNRNPGRITLVPVGPLTNIALAMLRDPGLSARIPEIILMGGSIVGGNATAAAEANIYHDPEAAKVVFGSGVPIVMVDLGATSQARITRRHLEELRRAPSSIAKFVVAIADFYVDVSERLGASGAALHDPLAVGISIDKTLARVLRPMHIDVETKGELTYGETVANRGLREERVEWRGDRYVVVDFPVVKPNAEVPIEVHGERFIRMFMERISRPENR